MSDQRDYYELEERVVQETEIHDTLADIEGYIRDTNTGFVRVTIEAISAEQHRANEKLAKAVAETDVCLSCGEPIEYGGFCNLNCLKSLGDEHE